jgi:apolipoprotein N-acyltransferase
MKITSILQIVGVISFVLASFDFKWGWFIGFLCSGLFFLLKDFSNKKETRKNNVFGYTVGAFIVLYSFYYLFTKIM